MFQNFQVSVQFTAFFLCVNKLISKNAPVKGGLSKEKQKKYVNIGTSLVHSILTGVGSIIAFYRHPSLMDDLIHFQSDFAYKLAQLSLGYFIYDFYDCARICNFKLSKFWEMCIHHVVVIACFSCTISTHRFIGLTMGALLMEFNSIFLHARTLMLYTGRRETFQFKCVSVANIISLIFFRLYVTYELIKWFIVLDDPVVGYLLHVGRVGIFVIGIMNFFLLWRCIHSDFFKTQKSNLIE